ncbi:hypothetical protein NQ314_000988, partial [Rhamnusium bicolor]
KNFLFASDEVLKSNKNNVYVRSKIIQSKLFFKDIGNQSLVCKIINIAPEKYVPLVYDVLLAIFCFSDDKIRQYHFHELLDYYYKMLEENLHNIDLSITTILPREKYDIQIKTFIPYIKLDKLYCYFRAFSQKVKAVNGAELKMNIQNFLSTNKRYENLIFPMILEVYECILYPNLSREDCYKIIRNKIGACEYEFLIWKLTPVDQRSGFLGDYFNLKINIKQDNENKTLHLFAKYLPTTNDVSIEMATASFNKERFFYGTFMSELKSLGLDDIIDFPPKCYFSRSNDVLIFEDISLLNYSSFKPHEALPYETLQVVIKQLAKFHACSFLYEEIITERTGQLVRIDDKYKKYVKEIFIQNEVESANQKIISCAIHAVLNYVLDEFPDIPKKITMDAFKSTVTEAFNLLYEKLYTYEEFLESCNYMKSAGICIASLYMQLTLYPFEKLQEFICDNKKLTHLFTVDRKEILDEMHRSEMYRQRFKEIVEDLYDVCVNDRM